MHAREKDRNESVELERAKFKNQFMDWHIGDKHDKHSVTNHMVNGQYKKRKENILNFNKNKSHIPFQIQTSFVCLQY